MLKLSPAALDRVRLLIQERSKPTLGVRVSLKTKGCSGLSYALEYVDDPLPNDTEVEEQGVRIYIDPRAALFLVGAEMDYQEDDIRSGFLFHNPNEKGRCGCGESFRVS